MINLGKEGWASPWPPFCWRIDVLETQNVKASDDSPYSRPTHCERISMAEHSSYKHTSNGHCPTNMSFGSKSTIVSLCLTKEIGKRSWLLNSMKILTHFRMECWPLWFFPYSLTLDFSHQIPSNVKFYSFQNCIRMQGQAFTFGRQKFS